MVAVTPAIVKRRRLQWWYSPPMVDGPEAQERTSTAPDEDAAVAAPQRLGTVGDWLERKGLIAPPAYRESQRLLRNSWQLFALARQVSASTGCSEDAAPLLAKALQRLCLAVLRLDVEALPDGTDCVGRVLAQPEHKPLFEEIARELDTSATTWADFCAGRDAPTRRAAVCDALLQRWPATYHRVRQDQRARLHRLGVRPWRRRLWFGVPVVVAVGALAVPAYRHTRASAGWTEQAPSTSTQPEVIPPEDPATLQNEQLCFRGTYYGDRDFRTPVHQRRDCRIHFDWDEAVVDGIPELPADGFSVRWEGLLRVPATDEYVFYLTSDDGSRLTLDDEVIIDNWGDHGALERESRPVQLQAGQDYRLRVEYYDAAEVAQVHLMWSSSALSKRTLSGQYVGQPRPDSSTPATLPSAELSELLADPAKCFTASYFEGKRFERLVHTRRDCSIDFDWRGGRVDGIEETLIDEFSVRWEGVLRVPATDEYVFYLGSDDGSRLYLEDRPIVGDWQPHGFGFLESSPIKLEQDVDYPIRVEYYDAFELASIRLQWRSSTITRQPLSGRYVTPQATAATSQDGGE